METREMRANVIPLTYLLPIIILVEGFASIAVEILTIRQLLPVAGGSVIVTSLIIGVFLLFLALGYECGGKVQYKMASVLRRNFLITAVLMGVGLSYIFIALFFEYMAYFTGPRILYPLIAYLLVVLAPIVFLLGQTLPITMNIVRQDKLAGAIAGKAMGLSTVGSFFGAILTTVVLMHFLGVAKTVFIVFALLMMLALLLSKNKYDLTMRCAFAFFAAWLIYILNIQAENINFVHTNTYGNYQILNDTNSTLASGKQVLVVNNNASSMIDERRHVAFPYVELIKKIIFKDIKLKNGEVLVLGAGGFSLSQTRHQHFGNHFTYVDIDDQLDKIIVPDFVRKMGDTLVADDARHYLKVASKKYDVIVVDVYSNRKLMPAHIATYEFMREVQGRLQRNGTAIFNVISKPTLSDAFSKRIDNTIRGAFGGCMAIPMHYIDAIANVVYVCSNKHNANDMVVYRDNLNTSTTDAFDWK